MILPILVTECLAKATRDKTVLVLSSRLQSVKAICFAYTLRNQRETNAQLHVSFPFRPGPSLMERGSTPLGWVFSPVTHTQANSHRQVQHLISMMILNHNKLTVVVTVRVTVIFPSKWSSRYCLLCVCIMGSAKHCQHLSKHVWRVYWYNWEVHWCI